MEHNSSHQYNYGNQYYQTTNQQNPIGNNLVAGVNINRTNTSQQNNDYSSNITKK